MASASFFRPFKPFLHLGAGARARRPHHLGQGHLCSGVGMRVLGGGVVSYERGTPVGMRVSGIGTRGS